MILKFKPSIPIEHKVDKITRTLNSLKNISATSEFIDKTPIHYLITIEVPDNTTHEDVLEIGVLIGVLDNDK